MPVGSDETSTTITEKHHSIKRKVSLAEVFLRPCRLPALDGGCE